MKQTLFFWLTPSEADALLVLDLQPAAWKTFDGRTLRSLVKKGLLAQRGRRYVLSRAGDAAKSLTTALRSLTRDSER